MTTISDEQIDVARKAIIYVLKRIQSDPDARYLMGACTESLAQLCAAHAALSLEPTTAKETEELVLNPRQDMLGDSVWDRLKEASAQLVKAGLR